MREIVALLIGAAAGYLGVRLGDLGEIAIGLLLGALIAYYVWRGRAGSASGLCLGAGSAVVFVLGAVVVDSVHDPAVRVEAPTYVGLLIGILLAAFGVALGVIAIAHRR